MLCPGSMLSSCPYLLVPYRCGAYNSYINDINVCSLAQLELDLDLLVWVSRCLNLFPSALHVK